MKNSVNYESVANYFISLSNETGNLITNLKLQKLVYYTQAWALAINNEKIFDSDFEAWVHGPVLRELYAKYKKFQWKPIDENVGDSIEILASMPEDVRSVVKEVTDEYFGLSAYELERLTHAEEPWIKARKGVEASELSRNIISKDSMRSYYGKLVRT